VSWRQLQAKVNELAEQQYLLYRERAHVIHNAGGYWLVDDGFAAKMATIRAEKARLWDQLRRELCFETQPCVFSGSMVRHRVPRHGMGQPEGGHVPQARLHASETEG